LVGAVLVIIGLIADITGIVQSAFGVSLQDLTYTYVLRKTHPVDLDHLKVGECLLDGSLGLDDSSAEFPVAPRVSSCRTPHDAEVFLMTKPWGLDAKFPGDESAQNTADSRCRETFSSYIGISWEDSRYQYVSVAPSNSTWDGGDREILCVVFDPEGRVKGSLRGVGD
jgi:hypothetical protein